MSAGVVAGFSREQLTALMFLSSEVLEGIGLAERVEIWNHLRENGGKISFDDLVEIGVYKGDELADGGFWRWLQGLDLGGGPANFAGMLEVEYELNSYGTSFAMLDAQQRRERGAQMVVMLAMMAGPIVGGLLTGPSGVGASSGAQAVGHGLKPQNLMDELAKSGVKYNAADVVMVTKTPNGKLMWLENGNLSAGLKHIVNNHASHFADKGIINIPVFLQKILQTTPIESGMGFRGPYANYLNNGSIYRVAYGSNGFIVTFYPIQ